MATLAELLKDLEVAITEKNAALFYQNLREVRAFLEKALAPVAFTTLSDSTDKIIDFNNPPPELAELQNFLTHPKTSPYFYLFSRIISQIRQLKDPDKMNSFNIGLYRLRKTVPKIAATLPFNQVPYDFSFLVSTVSASANRPAQTVLGKPSSKKDKRVLPGTLVSMQIGHWLVDANPQTSTTYLTTKEKKLYKIRPGKDKGVLSRKKDNGSQAPNGDYTYIISPKGSLYAFITHREIKSGHHSTMRAGQPVICAGELEIVNGKIIKIDCNSGHYTIVGQEIQTAESIS